MASKCSFTTCKLRFFGHFCLGSAASITFFNSLLTWCLGRRHASDLGRGWRLVLRIGAGDWCSGLEACLQSRLAAFPPLPLLQVVFHRRAGAEQVAVAVDVVDAVRGGPEFVLPQPSKR